MDIEIGDKEYEVKVAKTLKEKEQGLQGVTELEEDEGMLFVFDPPEDVSMWMKGTLIPLDIIFINSDNEVTFVGKGLPEDTKLITVPNTKYVLEVNVNSGVKEGDKLDFEEEDEDDIPVMKVLALDGSTLMDLWGGERIISRRETKILIKKAKKALQSKKDSDYRTLGRYIFKVFKKQDNREPEYVSTSV